MPWYGAVAVVAIARAFDLMPLRAAWVQSSIDNARAARSALVALERCGLRGGLTNNVEWYIVG